MGYGKVKVQSPRQSIPTRRKVSGTRRAAKVHGRKTTRAQKLRAASSRGVKFADIRAGSIASRKKSKAAATAKKAAAHAREPSSRIKRTPKRKIVKFGGLSAAIGGMLRAR